MLPLCALGRFLFFLARRNSCHISTTATITTITATAIPFQAATEAPRKAPMVLCHYYMFGRVRTECMPGVFSRKNTLPKSSVRFGTAPVNTLPNTPVRFRTTLILVPDTWVSWVRPPKMPRVPEHPTEHTLATYYTACCAWKNKLPSCLAPQLSHICQQRNPPSQAARAGAFYPT